MFTSSASYVQGQLHLYLAFNPDLVPAYIAHSPLHFLSPQPIPPRKGLQETEPYRIYLVEDFCQRVMFWP